MTLRERYMLLGHEDETRAAVDALPLDNEDGVVDLSRSEVKEFRQVLVEAGVVKD